MATDNEVTSSLSWSLGSLLFRSAFAELGRGLRWMFWGFVAQAAGMGLLVACLGGALLGVRGAGLLLPLSLIAMVVGAWIFLWGEQKCLHIELPGGLTHLLPGRRLLQTAYWFHLAAILLRMLRGFGGEDLLRRLAFPLELIGFICLLLFLRRISAVIQRHDLRRNVDLIFALLGDLVLLVGGLVAWRFVTGQELSLRSPMGIMIFGLFVLLPVCGVLSYVVLLWRMGSAAIQFSSLLKESPEPGEDDLESAGPVELDGAPSG